MDKHIWYKTRTKKMSVEQLNDLTISTDGIHTFKNFDGQHYQEISPERIMSKFFEDKSDMDNKNKLKKTLIDISDKYGLMPSDDLTMIRAISANRDYPKFCVWGGKVLELVYLS